MKCIGFIAAVVAIVSMYFFIHLFSGFFGKYTMYVQSAAAFGVWAWWIASLVIGCRHGRISWQ